MLDISNCSYILYSAGYCEYHNPTVKDNDISGWLFFLEISAIFYKLFVVSSLDMHITEL
jgi:hypothetical protein